MLRNTLNVNFLVISRVLKFVQRKIFHSRAHTVRVHTIPEIARISISLTGLNAQNAHEIQTHRQGQEPKDTLQYRVHIFSFMSEIEKLKNSPGMIQRTIQIMWKFYIMSMKL